MASREDIDRWHRQYLNSGIGRFIERTMGLLRRYVTDPLTRVVVRFVTGRANKR